MRTALKKYNKKQVRVHATISSYGRLYKRKGKGCRAVVLINIRDALTGEMLTDHLTILKGTPFLAKGASPGDYVTFTGRVGRYMKGGNRTPKGDYRPLEVDYRIYDPTELTVKKAPTTQAHMDSTGGLA